MTIEDVKKRIAAIREVKGDYEKAHSREDELWCDVLRAISKGADNAQELAQEVLKSRRIQFARACS